MEPISAPAVPDWLARAEALSRHRAAKLQRHNRSFLPGSPEAEADRFVEGALTPDLIAGATYTNIADTTTTVPGQSTVFSRFYGTAAISGSNVAFTAAYNKGTSGQGIYTGVVGTTGATRIADTSMNAPGQSTAFSSFGVPAISGSNVAFNAAYTDGGGPQPGGIYTGVAGTTGATRIADFMTFVPGITSPQLSDFQGFLVPVISGSNVAFYGTDGGTNRGIYTWEVGTTGATRVADTSMDAPSQSTTFSDFNYGLGPPAISGSNVAFEAEYDGGGSQGIYTGVAGTTGTTRIADTSMNAPGQSFTFSSFNFGYYTSAAISGTNVAFQARYGGGGSQGIYTGVAGMTGATRIIDTSMNVPGQSFTFSNFGSPGISGSNVVFEGNYYDASGQSNVSGQGIYTGVAGMTGATRIADTSMNAPGQSTAFSDFVDYQPLAVSGGNVAFEAAYKGGVGIFLYKGGILYDVAEKGESLFGGTISYLSFGASGLDGDTLTFVYDLTNGVEGVATVTLAPEQDTPPTATLVATTPSVSVSSGEIGEFTLSLSAAPTSDVTVSFTIKGTAVDGTDYVLLKTTKKIKAGKTSKPIKIIPEGNLDGASKKTVVLTLVPGDGYTVGTVGKVKLKLVQ